MISTNLKRQGEFSFSEIMKDGLLENQLFSTCYKMETCLIDMSAIELDNAYKIQLDILPDWKDDISIQIDGNSLVILYEKKEELEQKYASKTLNKIFKYSSYKRNITIPANIDRYKIRAEFSEGYLLLYLPILNEKLIINKNEKINITIN